MVKTCYIYTRCHLCKSGITNTSGTNCCNIGSGRSGNGDFFSKVPSFPASEASLLHEHGSVIVTVTAGSCCEQAPGSTTTSVIMHDEPVWESVTVRVILPAPAEPDCNLKMKHCHKVRCWQDWCHLAKRNLRKLKHYIP